MNSSNNNFFDTKVMGHPAGLFVLFFTEMWERFSYYGMRALLVMFFTASVMNHGWGWSEGHAYAIFGTYTSLVYLSTMLGGYFADKVIGYRWAVVVGALLMTVGHACMALETTFFIYTGLVFLVFGSGFFKPNMTSIVSEMYKDFPEKKDGAYTIFYMGVNAGAFFGIMLCGYLGEKVGWSWGFGVAGIFMLFGLLQFWLAQGIFGDIGLKPKKTEGVDFVATADGDRLNPFKTFDLVLIGIAAFLGLLWTFNSPISKITEGAYNIFKFDINGFDGNHVVILTALVTFVLLLFVRMSRYARVIRDRMGAIIFFAFITMFFWAVFEQSPSTLTKFAQNYTQRILEGSAGTIFKIADALITIVPLAIISYVLFQLFTRTFKKYALSNIFLAASFVIIWSIAGWKVYNDYKSSSYQVEYLNNDGKAKLGKIISSENYGVGDNISIKDDEVVEVYAPDDKGNADKVIEGNTLFSKDKEELGELFTANVVRQYQEAKIGAGINITKAEFAFINANGQTIVKNVKIKKDDVEKYGVGTSHKLYIVHNPQYDNANSKRTMATVKAKESAVEIGASWFGILNSLFIIAFAPLFSKLWESKYNLNANGKYALGMLLLGLGMAVIAIGASSIVPGQKTASLSIFWLVFVYLFHTLAELCVSPVALSYVSKLVPGRMIAIMFGIWYLAVAIGMKMAGLFGEFSESIAEEKGISYFFWMLTIVSLVLSALAFLTTPILKKLMHGIK